MADGEFRALAEAIQAIRKAVMNLEEEVRKIGQAVDAKGLHGRAA
jgi:hypothetical protein